MKKILLFLLFPSLVWAQSDLKLGQDSLNDYFLKEGSYLTTTDKAGVKIVAVTLKTVIREKQQESFAHYVLATQTCEKGQGKIIALDDDGKLQGSYPIKITNSDKMSVVAAALCDLYKSDKE